VLVATVLSREERGTLKKAALDVFAAFAVLFTDPGFFDPVMHGKVCNFLQYGQPVGDGGGWKKGQFQELIMPRGWLKTTLTCLYCVWRATRDPEVRVLYATNTEPNAEKKLEYIMQVVQKNPLYGVLFPERVPDFGAQRTRWGVQGAELKRAGTYPEPTFSRAGTRTKLTSAHFDLIVGDDLVAPDKDDVRGTEVMPTREDIEQAVGWYRMASPLMIDPVRSQILIAGTRWCNYDLFSYIDRNERDRYQRMDIRALEGGKSTYQRYTKDSLEAIRDRLGTFMFSALYMNNPMSSENATFKPEWVRETTELFDGGKVVVTVDPAISEKRDSADTAIVCVRHLPRLMVVEDYAADKMSPRDIIEKTFAMADKHGANKIRVESIAWQKALCHLMLEESNKRERPVTIAEFRSQVKKEVRIDNLAPHFEYGRVFIRPWMGVLRDQLLAHPNGEKVDVIDALAMQLPDYQSQDGAGGDEREPVDWKNYKFAVKFDDVLDSMERRRRTGGYAYL
jgi:predicted phage terminase large subunit-like protein